jgi:succinate dehydrogenase/fumarate reductase flavoprotein subunit
MTEHAGVLRSAAGLEQAGKLLSDLTPDPAAEPCTEAWEATNLLTVAQGLVTGARRREETRGSHWREDHPEPDPRWLGHLDTVQSASGRLETTFRTLGER